MEMRVYGLLPRSLGWRAELSLDDAVRRTHPDRLAVHGSGANRKAVALVTGADEGVLRGALWGDVAVEHPDVSAAVFVGKRQQGVVVHPGVKKFRCCSLECYRSAARADIPHLDRASIPGHDLSIGA